MILKTSIICKNIPFLMVCGGNYCNLVLVGAVYAAAEGFFDSINKLVRWLKNGRRTVFLFLLNDRRCYGC